MSQDHLATYLNDHLAGSVVAIELLAFLQDAHEDLKEPIRALRNEILSDRAELERLMGDLEVDQSPPRKVMAWVTEKVTHVKLWFDDVASGQLRLLEALEIVSLGIEGKKGLWRALAMAATSNPRLHRANYRELENRADQQRMKVETMRLDAALVAFSEAK